MVVEDHTECLLIIVVVLYYKESIFIHFFYNL